MTTGWWEGHNWAARRQVSRSSRSEMQLTWAINGHSKDDPTLVAARIASKALGSLVKRIIRVDDLFEWIIRRKRLFPLSVPMVMILLYMAAGVALWVLKGSIRKSLIPIMTSERWVEWVECPKDRPVNGRKFCSWGYQDRNGTRRLVVSHLQPPKVDRHYYRVNMIYGYLRRLFGCFSCRFHSYFAGVMFLFEDLVTTAVSIIQMFVSNSKKRRDMIFKWCIARLHS